MHLGDADSGGGHPDAHPGVQLVGLQRRCKRNRPHQPARRKNCTHHLLRGGMLRAFKGGVVRDLAEKHPAAGSGNSRGAPRCFAPITPHAWSR